MKPAPGTRKCNCKQKVVTQQIGPGMYQQYTTQVGVGPVLPQPSSTRQPRQVGRGGCHGDGNAHETARLIVPPAVTNGLQRTTSRPAHAWLYMRVRARQRRHSGQTCRRLFVPGWAGLQAVLTAWRGAPSGPPGVRGLPQRQVRARGRGADGARGAGHARRPHHHLLRGGRAHRGW